MECGWLDRGSEGRTGHQVEVRGDGTRHQRRQREARVEPDAKLRSGVLDRQNAGGQSIECIVAGRFAWCGEKNLLRMKGDLDRSRPVTTISDQVDITDADAALIATLCSEDFTRQNILNAEKGGDLGVDRPGEDLIDGTGLADRAVEEEDDPIGKVKRLITVMGDEDHRTAGIVDPAAQVVEQRTAAGGVEGGQRLIQEQDERLEGQGAGEADATLLPAREGAGGASGKMRDPGSIHPVRGAGGAIRTRDAVQPEPEGDVVADAAAQQEWLLEDDGHPPACRQGLS